MEGLGDEQCGEDQPSELLNCEKVSTHSVVQFASPAFALNAEFGAAPRRKKGGYIEC